MAKRASDPSRETHSTRSPSFIGRAFTPRSPPRPFVRIARPSWSATPPVVSTVPIGKAEEAGVFGGVAVGRPFQADSGGIVLVQCCQAGVPDLRKRKKPAIGGTIAGSGQEREYGKGLHGNRQAAAPAKRLAQASATVEVAE